MNRENKRKLYDKHYYKTHPCDEAFTCRHCGRLVVPEGAGSDHRNHCPYCLCSVHLDNAPGDREADCGALMEPIGVWVRKNGEWALLHRCRMCGTIHAKMRREFFILANVNETQRSSATLSGMSGRQKGKGASRWRR